MGEDGRRRTMVSYPAGPREPEGLVGRKGAENARDRRLRVLVITNMYPSRRELAYGLFVFRQVRALQEADVRVDVLAMRRRGRGWLGRAAYAEWMARGFLRLRRRYDVVHAHYAFPSGWIGLWHRRFRGTPLVVTVHGSDVLDLPVRYPRMKEMIARVLHAADRVITVSAFLRDELVSRWAVPPQRILVQSAGIDRQTFHTNREGAQRFRQRFGDQPLITFVGNLIPEKGVDVLVRAFARVRERVGAGHLILAGPPVNLDYFELLRNRVEELGLERNVTFMGPLPSEEVADLMSASDVFVLPSLREGLGLVALEAMACGVPVVASDVGGIPEVVQPGRTGLLVAPGDVPGLAGAIRRFLEDPVLARNCREAGLKLAAKHDIRQRVAQLLVLYQGLAARRGQGTGQTGEGTRRERRDQR